MSANAQLIGFMLMIGVPSLTALLGALSSNSHITGLRAHMDARFDAQDRSLAARLQLFEERIDARLARTERLLQLR